MDRLDPRAQRPLILAAAGLFCLIGCRAGAPQPAEAPAQRWPLSLGDGSPRVSALLATGGTGVVAGEAPHGLTLEGRTLSDVAGGYVLGLDPSGAARWVRTLEGKDGVVVDALADAEDGGVVFAGHFAGEVRSGSFELRSAGGRDCLVGRVDPTGRLQWLERWGTPGMDLCRAVLINAQRIWVAGSRPDAARAEASDALLLQFDPGSGALLGERAFAGAGDDHARALALDAHGRIAVGGMYGGPYDASGQRVVAEGKATLRWGDAVVAAAASDYDAFVVVFGEDGTVAGTGGWSSPGFDTVKDLVAAPEGGWVAVGVQQPGLAPGSGPGLAADHVPLGGIVAGMSAQAHEQWRFAESALSSASGVVVEPETIWVVGHARGPLGNVLGRGPRGGSAAVVFGLDRSGALNGAVRVCDGVAEDQGHAIAAGPDRASLWWAGAVSADADCLPGTGAQAGVLFRFPTTPP